MRYRARIGGIRAEQISIAVRAQQRDVNCSPMSQAYSLIPARFRAGLTDLLTAFDYAQDSQTDPWQFAVGLAEVLSAGANLADIRWLVLRGFAEHARETTVPGDLKRTFRGLAPT